MVAAPSSLIHRPGRAAAVLGHVLVLAGPLGCGGATDDPLELYGSGLSASQRRVRAEAIRDTARARGLANAALLGGIGDAETGLAHCWSEATWACQGPYSSSCGGPVIAGAGDGACALEQGGLGLFQFDGGTYDQTLARDGEGVLTLEGNISHAVDFILAMVVRSQFIEGVEDEAAALAYLDAVPIQPGDARFEAWVSTVTRYYNGCSPSSGCWASRRARYGDLTVGLYQEQGEDFWGAPPAPPPAPCALVPAEGRVIEETESCYGEGGAASGWRRVSDAGSGGALSWTYATSAAEDNFGVWSFVLAEAGTYRLEVYSDGGTYAASRRARYTITHDGVTDERVIDQASGVGFLPVAELAFAAGGGQSVRLGDDTGEPYADRVRLAFDAIRLVRVDTAPTTADPVEPGAPVPAEDPVPAATPAPVDARAGAPVAERGDAVSGEIAGGCRCVGGGSGSGALAMVVVAVALARGRRRSKTACARKPGGGGSDERMNVAETSGGRLAEEYMRPGRG